MSYQTALSRGNRSNAQLEYIDLFQSEKSPWIFVTQAASVGYFNYTRFPLYAVKIKGINLQEYDNWNIWKVHDHLKSESLYAEKDGRQRAPRLPVFWLGRSNRNKKLEQ